MHRNPLKTGLVVAVFAAILAGSADAQIVNTLRGFEDEEPGWSGLIAGGIAMAEGNTQYFEFELDGKIQYQTDRNRWRVIGVNTRRTAMEVEIAESRLGHFRHNFNLRSRFSTVAFLQGQYNPFLRIESRVLFGGGARAELYRGDLWRSAIGVTVMRETEELTVEDVDQQTSQPAATTTKYRFSYFFTLYRAGTKGFDVDIWGFYQPVIDDFIDARASAAASVRVDVVGEVYLLVSYVIEYDHSPPVGVKKRDDVLRSGLGWNF